MPALHSRVLYVLLVAVVALSSVPSAIVAAAQAGPANEGARARELLEAVSATVARLREMGVDVSRAEELLSRAREALERGDVGRARSLALLALIAAGSKAREARVSPRPIAAGVLVEIATLKRLVKELGYAELESKIREAEELYSKGLVNESVKVLKEIREAIRLTQEKLRKDILVKARAEIEATVRARVLEEKLVNELVKALRKAENLSAIGRALRVLRAYEKLKDKVDVSIAELSKDLANLSEKFAALVRTELEDGDVDLPIYPAPPGLVESVVAKIRLAEKLRDRLPDDLKPVANKLVEALVKLNKTVVRMLRCEENYAESLKEVRSTLAEVLKELSARLPPKTPPLPWRGSDVAEVVRLYAIAKWSYTVASSLQRIIVCPEIGSDVVFRGVVIEAENLTLAFGVVKMVKRVPIEPLYIEDLDLVVPKRAVVKVGVFVLDLSKLKNVSVSVGDIVSCVGRYVGYRELDRHPTIEVHQLWKLVRIDRLVEG